MAERIAFKGRLPNAFAAMSISEYKGLVKSRQRRWLSRNSIQYKKLSERIESRKAQGKPVRTHMREALILPSWVGMEFDVHNGKEFVRVGITPNMLGHRLGEFSPTTKRVQHSAPGIKATRGSKFLDKK
ncbi:ribosomal protein S19 family protein [Candidatus Marsarchaeota archaeon]|nr:ribosomal protein S19 family protein [Candidatus Marsarchaeota archaeon]